MSLKAQAQFTNKYEAAHSLLQSNQFFNEADWRKVATGNDASNLDMYIDALNKSKNLNKTKFDNDYLMEYDDSDSRLAALYNEVYSSKIANDDRYQVTEYVKDDAGNMLYDKDGNPKTKNVTVSEYEYNKRIIRDRNELNMQNHLKELEAESKNPNIFADVGSALTRFTYDGVIEFFNKTIAAGMTFGQIAFTDKTFENDWFTQWENNYVPVLDRLLVDDGDGGYMTATEFIEDFESKYSHLRDADGNLTTIGRYVTGVATTTGEMLAVAVPFLGWGGKVASVVRTAAYYTPLAVHSMGETYKEVNANGNSVAASKVLTNQLWKTGAEIAIESGLGKLFGSTGLDKFLFGKTDDVAKSAKKISTLRAVGHFAGEALQEGTEEFLQEFSGFLVDNAYGKLIDESFKQEFELQNFIDAAIIGALTSAAHSSVSIAATKAKEISIDGKVTKLGKISSAYYDVSMSDFLRNLGEAQKKLDGMVFDTKTGKATLDFSNEVTDIRKRLKEINKALKNESITEESKKALETEKTELLKKRLEAVVKLGESTKESSKSSVDGTNFAESFKNMYVAARVIQSFAGNIGEERMKKASEILERVEKLRTDGKLTEGEVVKSRNEMVKELQLNAVVVDKGLIDRIKDSDMTSVLKVLKRKDVEKISKESAQSDEAPNRLAKKVFDSSPERETVVITEDGSKVAANDETICIPKAEMDQGIAQVLHDEAEQRLVAAISAYNFKGDVINRVVKTYRSIHGEDAKANDAIYALIFDESFFITMLSGGVDKNGTVLPMADMDMYQLLSSLITIEKSVIASNIREGVYKTKIESVRKSMSKALVAYLKLQPFADYELDFLSKQDKSEIRLVRESFDVANRIVTGKATESDWNHIFKKINNSTMSKDEKSRFEKSLKESDQLTRRKLLSQLDESYRIAFYSAYDGKTYLPLNSIKNRTFNQFLYNIGTTLNNLLSVELSVDVLEKIKKLYGGNDTKHIVRFYSAQLSSMTQGRYKLEIGSGNKFNPESGVFISNGVTLKVVDTKSSFDSVVVSDVRSSKDNVTVKRGSKNQLWVNGLLSQSALKSGAGYYTIDDVVTNPSLLKDSIRDVIKHNYQEITPESTYRYLKSYFAKKGSVTLSVASDGRVIFVDTVLTQKLLSSDFSAEMVKRVVKGEISANELLDEKYRMSSLDEVSLVLSDSPSFSVDDIVVSQNRGSKTPVIRISKSALNDVNELKTEFAHELQHFIQETNRLNTGTSADVLSMFSKEDADQIIREVKQKVPEMFKNVSNSSTDTIRMIVNDFLYYSSGERTAYGSEINDSVKFYPSLIQESSDKKTFSITLPWGSTFKSSSLGRKHMSIENALKIQSIVSRINYGDVSLDDVVNVVHDVFDVDQSIGIPFELRDKIFKSYQSMYGDVGKISFVSDEEIRAIKNDGKRYSGLYNAKDGIMINADVLRDRLYNNDYSNAVKSILHEFLHAVTLYRIKNVTNIVGDLTLNAYLNTGLESEIISKLDDVDKAALGLIKLWYELKNSETQSMYALSNVDEFVAELANPSFRTYLKEKTLWQRLINMFRRLLGLDVTTALDVADRAINTILDYEIEYNYDLSDESYLNDVKKYKSLMNSKNEKDILECAEVRTSIERRLRRMAQTHGFYSSELYHGTDRFGFTEVDVSKSDDNLTFFATDDIRVAGTYTNHPERRNISDRLQFNENDRRQIFKDKIEQDLNDRVNRINNLFKTEELITNNVYKGLVNATLDYLADLRDGKKDFDRYVKRVVSKLDSSVYAETTSEFRFGKDLVNQDELNMAFNGLIRYIDTVESAIQSSNPKTDFSKLYDNLRNNFNRFITLLRKYSPNALNKLLEDDMLEKSLVKIEKIYEAWTDYELLFKVRDVVEEFVYSAIDYRVTTTVDKSGDINYGVKYLSEDGIQLSEIDSAELTSIFDDITSIIKNSGSDHRRGIYGLYANLDNALVINADGAKWSDIPFAGSKYDTRYIAGRAFREGYSLVIIKNVEDTGNELKIPSTVYIFKNPEKQLRSSDLITYDDDGNIVPLSERFKPGSDDLRFDEYYGDVIEDEQKIDGDLHLRSKGRTKRGYVAKKAVKGTPLEAYGGKRISLPLQDFIMKSADKEYEGLDKNILKKIKDGLLTTSDLYEYLRECDSSDESAEVTFRLINDSIFHNKHIKSLEELDNYIFTKTNIYYAMRVYLRIGGKSEALVETEDPTLYDRVLEAMENDLESKSRIMKIAERYWSGAVINEKNLRRLWMQHFDGSVESGGYIAAVAKVAAYNNWLISGGEGSSTSLDMTVGRGKDKSSTLKKEDVIPSSDDIDDLNRFINHNRVNRLEEAMRHDLVIKFTERLKAGEDITRSQVDKALNELSEEVYYIAQNNPGKFAELYSEFVKDDEELANALYLRRLANEVAGREVNSVDEALEEYENAKESAKEILRPKSYVIANVRSMSRTIRGNLNREQRNLFLKQNDDLFDKDLEVKKSLYHDILPNGVVRLKDESILLEIEERVRKLSNDVQIGVYSNEMSLKYKKYADRKIAELTRKLNEAKSKTSVRYVTVYLNNQVIDIDTDREVPSTVQRLLDTTFTKNSKTKVQLLSGDDEYHVQMNYETFLSENAITLHHLTQSDADEICDFYLATAPRTADGETNTVLYSSVELWTLGYLVEMSGKPNSNFTLSDDRLNRIEDRLKFVAHRASTELSTWKSVLKKIKPDETLHKAMLKICNIELSPKTEGMLITAIKSGNMEKIQEAKRRAYAEVVSTYKTKKRTVWDRLLKYERMAMLSGPGTWVRNLTSNLMVTAANDVSDFLGKFLPRSKNSERFNQYKIIGTKIKSGYAAWVKTAVMDSGLLDLISDGLIKYDTRRTLKTGTDNQLVKLIVSKIESDLFDMESNLNPVSKFMQTVMKTVMSDKPFINKSFVKYLGKMLTEDNADVTKGIGDPKILDTIAEAYTMALKDYMHNASFFGKLENQLQTYLHKHFSPTTADGIFFMYKQVMPFANASWNWFVEGLNYTPFGLAKGLVDFCRLENTVNQMENARQKGEHVRSARFAEYLAKRKIVKGAIGSVGLGIGILLAALGKVRLDEEDDKYKLAIASEKGVVYFDFSDVFASNGLMLGMSIAQSCKDDVGLMKVLSNSLNTMFEESTFSDMFNTFRYSNSLGDYLTEVPLSIVGMFVPNFIKTVGNTFKKYNITYSSGLKGRMEKFAVQTFAPFGRIFNMAYSINPYTGDPEVVNSGWFGINLLNRYTPVKVKNYAFGDIEKIAVSLGVRKGQLSGKYEIDDKSINLSSAEIEILNQFYGKLNAKTLEDFMMNKTSYTVEDENGDRETITYKNMTDKQKKAVIERIMSNNSQLAKVYVLTSSKGYKYYASDSEYERLRDAGVITNVYRKTGKFDGFVKN